MITLILIFFGVTHAADIVGNGGDGVYRNEKLYLLDLVEVRGDLYKAPYFTSNYELPTTYSDRIDSLFLELDVDKNLIKQKLAEIHNWSAPWALLILRTFEQYEWVLEDRRLPNVTDENTVLIDQLYQIALRLRFEVFIDELYFSQLDQKNRVALIFHEAVYALTNRVFSGRIISKSWVARKINGLLFHQQDEKIWKRIYKEADKYIPSFPSNKVVKETQNGFGEYYLAKMDVLFYDVYDKKRYVWASQPKERVSQVISEVCDGGRIGKPYATAVTFSRHSLIHKLGEHNEGFYMKTEFSSANQRVYAESDDVSSERSCRKSLHKHYRKIRN